MQRTTFCPKCCATSRTSLFSPFMVLRALRIGGSLSVSNLICFGSAEVISMRFHIYLHRRQLQWPDGSFHGLCIVNAVVICEWSKMNIRAVSEAKRAPAALSPVATAGLKAVRDAEVRGLEALRSPLRKKCQLQRHCYKLSWCKIRPSEPQNTIFARGYRRRYESSIELREALDVCRKLKGAESYLLNILRDGKERLWWLGYEGWWSAGSRVLPTRGENSSQPKWLKAWLAARYLFC